MERIFRILLLTTLVLAKLNYCSADTVPSISFISGNQIKTIGDNVKLTCSVENVTDSPVLWIKLDKENGPLTISYLDFLILRDDRFSVRHDSAKSTYTLEIKRLEEMDGGTYQCQVLMGATKRVTANVKVMVEKSISVTTSDPPEETSGTSPGYLGS